jgi:hypothetical protein
MFQGWANKKFLNTFIEAIPTYVMSCLQIPITYCDMRRATISNEWCYLGDGKKKMH